MKQQVCPIWVGYLLSSPTRKLFQNPQKILSPFVKKGMTVADIGCAMGFYSIPLAQMVGENGRVLCIDLQERMLSVLKNKARRKNFIDQMEFIQCREDSLQLSKYAAKIDFALVSAVVHEVPDAHAFFSELWISLKVGGQMLFAEPTGHVKKTDFEKSIKAAQDKGFVLLYYVQVAQNFAAILEKVN